MKDRRGLKAIRQENKKRLRDLGLPTDLFSEGFWEREMAARQVELIMLSKFEEMVKSGAWDNLTLPWKDILDRWKAEIASPMHFASMDARPRWMRMMSKTADDWKRRNEGRMGKSWKAYKRRRLTKLREQQGKPPPKFRTPE